MYINVRKINKRSNINFRNTILLLKIRILTHIFYIAIAIFYRNCDILSQLRYFAIAIFAIFRIYFFAVTKRNETAISCGNSASRNTAGNPIYKFAGQGVSLFIYWCRYVFIGHVSSHWLFPRNIKN